MILFTRTCRRLWVRLWATPDPMRFEEGRTGTVRGLRSRPMSDTPDPVEPDDAPGEEPEEERPRSQTPADAERAMHEMSRPAPDPPDVEVNIDARPT